VYGKGDGKRGVVGGKSEGMLCKALRGCEKLMYVNVTCELLERSKKFMVHED